MQTIASPKIAFSQPWIGDAERHAVAQALACGGLSGNGPFGRAAEATLRSLCGVRHALLTTSCTHALEMALMALDLAPGDEVILPSFTFPSSANAIVLQGAVPVFVDIDPRTFNIDPERISEAVTPRTRGILPVHYAGQACDMDAIRRIADTHNLFVLEDAAQAVGASWGLRPLGSLGTAGCLSFHGTKNIACGEGGALLTDDDALAGRAEIIREKGTNRSAFVRGEVDRYTWVGVGSSYVLSDVLAALLDAQLRRVHEITGRRLEVWERYHAGVAPLEHRGLVQRPYFHFRASNNAHIYPLLILEHDRDAVIAAMRERGIACASHFVPLHSSPFLRARFPRRRFDLPVTDRVSQSLLRLPLSPQMTVGDTDRVLEALEETLTRSRL